MRNAITKAAVFSRIHQKRDRNQYNVNFSSKVCQGSPNEMIWQQEFSRVRPNMRQILVKYLSPD